MQVNSISYTSVVTETRSSVRSLDVVLEGPGKGQGILSVCIYFKDNLCRILSLIFDISCYNRRASVKTNGLEKVSTHVIVGPTLGGALLLITAIKVL